MTLRDLERTSGLFSTGTQMKDLIRHRTLEAIEQADAARALVDTPQALARRQEQMREAFLASIGGLPSCDTPLNARVTGAFQRDGYRVEKVILESRPGVYVTCNLYLPDSAERPRPAALVLCGHSLEAKEYTGYQAVCQAFALSGFVVLAQDPLGQGERLGYYDPETGRTTVDPLTVEHSYVGAKCLPLGQSIARYFVHDSMRAVDYLLSRPEVDGSRIAVTGASGGGTQTAMMMLADPRIAAAAPATYVSSRRRILWGGNGQDAEQIWPGSTALGLDHEDFLLCMAPKPVIVLAATYDFFPIEGTRNTVNNCKRFWRMHGRPDALILHEEPCGHSYTRTMAMAAASFLRSHLGGEELTQDERTRILHAQPEQPEQLHATATGQVRADFPDARFVQQECAALAEEIDPSAYSRSEAQRWLRRLIQKDRLDTEILPRLYLSETVFEDLLFQPVMWNAQETVLGHGYLLRPAKMAKESVPVVIALWQSGTDALAAHYEWIKARCAQGEAVLVLDTAYAGKLTPFPTTPYPRERTAMELTMNAQASNLLWLGDSLAALRAYDVVRAVDALCALPMIDPERISIYCESSDGVCGLLAAFADERILSCTDRTGFHSYRAFVAQPYHNDESVHGFVLPNVLHHFDLPQMRGWMKDRML